LSVGRDAAGIVVGGTGDESRAQRARHRRGGPRPAPTARESAGPSTLPHV
jgi:hypothetical protein